jgi:hypothetical protein
MDSHEFLDELENKFQDTNDLIAVFCGGKLQNVPMIGTVYRFDEPKTPVYLMKCPPMGILLRSDEQGVRCMEFHCNYNWLMFAIKYCTHKQITSELKDKYKEMCESLTVFFDIPESGGSTKNMEIQWTYSKLIEFVKIYNDTINN